MVPTGRFELFIDLNDPGANARASYFYVAAPRSPRNAEDIEAERVGPSRQRRDVRDRGRGLTEQFDCRLFVGRQVAARRDRSRLGVRIVQRRLEDARTERSRFVSV